MIGPRPDSRSCASVACLDLNSQIGKHTPDKWSCGIFDLGDNLQTFTVSNKNLMTTASDSHYSSPQLLQEENVLESNPSEKGKYSGLESSHWRQSEKLKQDNLHKTNKNNNVQTRPDQTNRKIDTQAWLTQKQDKKLRMGRLQKKSLLMDWVH